MKIGDCECVLGYNSVIALLIRSAMNVMGLYHGELLAFIGFAKKKLQLQRQHPLIHRERLEMKRKIETHEEYYSSIFSIIGGKKGCTAPVWGSQLICLG